MHRGRTLRATTLNRFENVAEKVTDSRGFPSSDMHLSRPRNFGHLLSSEQSLKS
jgi:hypothetical protein